MNQGARDANAELNRMAAMEKQDQILAELQRMNSLLGRIINAVMELAKLKGYSQ